MVDQTRNSTKCSSPRKI